MIRNFRFVPLRASCFVWYNTAQFIFVPPRRNYKWTACRGSYVREGHREAMSLKIPVRHFFPAENPFHSPRSSATVVRFSVEPVAH